MKASDVSAVILAAGLGTRMKSNKAKVLHHVAGKPMVHYPVAACLDAGVSQVIVVVGHQKELVAQYLSEHFDERVSTAVQHQQLGTGDAVQAAMPTVINKNTLILSGDVPAITQAFIEDLLIQSQEHVVTFASFKADDPTGYGRVVRNENLKPISIVEHKDATAEQQTIDEVNAGLYLSETQLLNDYLGQLQNDNAQNEFYITDLVSYGHGLNLPVHAWCVDTPEMLAGINNLEELAAADARLRA